MRDYVIMTDSCCDLDAREVAENDLRVVPLSFTIDGATYHDTPDHAEMPLSDFYRRLRSGQRSVTAAANVADFTLAMRSVLDAGRDILCIAFSSALSTTYQSACIAADELRGDYPDARIVVIDSLSASRGQGMLVCCAAREKAKGRSLDAVADWVRENLPRQQHWFTVDDLNHLRRGGRLNAAGAVIGTMLSIKPVLHCDAAGKLMPVSKARGMKQALSALVDKLAELGKHPLSEQPVFLSHADAPQSVELVVSMLRERLGVTDMRVGYMGPVVGSHTGAGALAMFFLGNSR